MQLKYYIRDEDAKEDLEFYDTLEEAEEGLESLNADGRADNEHHWCSPYVIKQCNDKE
jgi:hypothetical protein